MCFATLDDLDDLVRWLGAEAKLAAIRASARPTLRFRREVVEDDALPVGAHKFGGHPDWPRGVAWPRRPAWPDAQGKAAELRAKTEGVRAHILAQAPNPPNAIYTRFAQSRLDDLDTDCAARSTVLFAPFPLMFVAQFDLGALAMLNGLDPALPREGLLSVFADFTWEGHCGQHWVFWHEPTARLARRAPPRQLIAQHDSHGHYNALPWQTLRTSERLDPISVITVPDHWWDGRSRGHIDLSRMETQLPPRKPVEDDLRTTYHQLGGWPETLQFQHPEHELAGGKSDGIEAAGITPWRNLYSYDPDARGERVMYAAQGGGDRMHVMIRDEDLRFRRFGATKTVAIYD